MCVFTFPTQKMLSEAKIENVPFVSIKQTVGDEQSQVSQVFSHYVKKQCVCARLAGQCGLSKEIDHVKYGNISWKIDQGTYRLNTVINSRPVDYSILNSLCFLNYSLLQAAEKQAALQMFGPSYFVRALVHTTVRKLTTDDLLERLFEFSDTLRHIWWVTEIVGNTVHMNGSILVIVKEEVNIS